MLVVVDMDDLLYHLLEHAGQVMQLPEEELYRKASASGGSHDRNA